VRGTRVAQPAPAAAPPAAAPVPAQRRPVPRWARVLPTLLWLFGAAFAIGALVALS
ncbi:MAG: forkhead-associated protein, partial [Frankia sp.]|nr:forkhead-associated protein [Frankia sp.]